MAPAWAEIDAECVQHQDPALQISSCTEAIQSGRLEPSNLAVAYYNRSVAHVNQGQYWQAIQDLDASLRLNRDFPPAYNLRGLAHVRLGEFGRAVQALNEALRLDPDYVAAYSNRAFAYAGLREFDRAVADLDRALQLDPDFSAGYYNRALARMSLGGFRSAIEDFNQALRLERGDADLFIERGVAYLNLGEPLQAIKDFDQAVRLDPKIAGAYFGRGEAYSNLGEYERAVEEYGEALRLDPTYELAKHGRAFALRQLRQGEVPQGQHSDSADREAVLAAQRMLAQLGLYEDAIDGIVGPNTRRAVREFQEAWGYPPTGEIDERLLGQLDVVTKAAADLAHDEEAAAESETAKEDAKPAPEQATEEEPVEAALDEAAELEVTSAGSGFFVMEDGWILTNRHVVEGCVETDVVVAGTRMRAARRIVSLASDLALLKTSYVPPSVAQFRAGKGIRPGETVVAIGFPLVWYLSPEVNVTTGNVSALAGIRGDATELQHTAPIQPGNSGGPLLDDSGNVVAVTVAKADAIEIAKATGDIPENIGFAIKASVARDFLDAEGIDYAMAPSDMRRDIADLVVETRPHVALVLCLK